MKRILLSLQCLLSISLLNAGFTGDMVVKTTQGQKPIKYLKVGDKVICFKDGYWLTSKPIETIQTRTINDILKVTTAHGDTLYSCPDAQFYAPKGDTWQVAHELKVGSWLLGLEKMCAVKVKNVEKIQGTAEIVDINVQDLHNFGISKNSILVHNGLVDDLKNKISKEKQKVTVGSQSSDKNSSSEILTKEGNNNPSGPKNPETINWRVDNLRPKQPDNSEVPKVPEPPVEKVFDKTKLPQNKEPDIKPLTNTTDLDKEPIQQTDLQNNTDKKPSSDSPSQSMPNDSTNTHQNQPSKTGSISSNSHLDEQLLGMTTIGDNRRQKALQASLRLEEQTAQQIALLIGNGKGDLSNENINKILRDKKIGDHDPVIGKEFVLTKYSIRRAFVIKNAEIHKQQIRNSKVNISQPQYGALPHESIIIGQIFDAHGHKIDVVEHRLHKTVEANKQALEALKNLINKDFAFKIANESKNVNITLGDGTKGKKIILNAKDANFLQSLLESKKKSPLDQQLDFLVNNLDKFIEQNKSDKSSGKIVQDTQQNIVSSNTEKNNIKINQDNSIKKINNQSITQPNQGNTDTTKILLDSSLELSKLHINLAYGDIMAREHFAAQRRANTGHYLIEQDSQRLNNLLSFHNIEINKDDKLDIERDLAVHLLKYPDYLDILEKSSKKEKTENKKIVRGLDELQKLICQRHAEWLIPKQHQVNLQEINYQFKDQSILIAADAAAATNAAVRNNGYAFVKFPALYEEAVEKQYKDTGKYLNNQNTKRLDAILIANNIKIDNQTRLNLQKEMAMNMIRFFGSDYVFEMLELCKNDCEDENKDMINNLSDLQNSIKKRHENYLFKTKYENKDQLSLYDKYIEKPLTDIGSYFSTQKVESEENRARINKEWDERLANEKLAQEKSEQEAKAKQATKELAAQQVRTQILNRLNTIVINPMNGQRKTDPNNKPTNKPRIPSQNQNISENNETQLHDLTNAARELLQQNGYDTNAYSTMYGNQLQQQIHKNCILLLEKVTCISSSSAMHPYKDSLVDCIDSARDYNQVGLTQKASLITDFCNSVLDYSLAIGEGIIQGLTDVVKNSVEHPFQTALTVVAGEYMIAYRLSEMLFKVADIGLTKLFDSNKGNEKWDAYIKPINAVIDALCSKKITLQEKVTGIARFATYWKAENKLLNSLNNFYKTAQNQAFEYIKKNPSATPDDYIATPEGLVFKISRIAQENNYPEQCIKNEIPQEITSILKQLQGFEEAKNQTLEELGKLTNDQGTKIGSGTGNPEKCPCGHLCGPSCNCGCSCGCGIKEQNNPKNDDKKWKTVEDIIRECKPGKESGKTQQYTKPGGFDTANKDFDSLQPTNVQDKGDGIRVGDLPDGKTAVVRPTSTDLGDGSFPTLEIMDKNKIDKTIKFRYTNE